MNKSFINPMPQFFDTYINLVEQENLMDAFVWSVDELENIDISMLKKIGSKVYAPGKWTINSIFQHIIDNERIQAYRALRFARKDTTTLPGYDENLLANNAFADNRRLENIIDELKVVRQSTILLYAGLEKSALLNNGFCFGQHISPLALGFVIVGHQQHHFNIMKERYYSL